MSRIPLNNSQSRIIDDCCKKLDIKHDYEANTTLYNNVINLERICKNLQYDLNDFLDVLTDVQLSIVDHDIEKLVQGLKEMTDFIPELSQDINTINESTKDAVASFIATSEKIGFSLLYDDKHIKQLIENNFKENTTMSVGYKDGEFALMFCEIIDEIEQPPFSINVIAKGEREAYDYVQAYINRLLDFEHNTNTN